MPFRMVLIQYRLTAWTSWTLGLVEVVYLCLTHSLSLLCSASFSLISVLIRLTNTLTTYCTEIKYELHGQMWYASYTVLSINMSARLNMIGSLAVAAPLAEYCLTAFSVLGSQLWMCRWQLEWNLGTVQDQCLTVDWMK